MSLTGLGHGLMRLLGRATPTTSAPRRTRMPKITMYSTGFCPFCIRAKQLLKSKGIEQIDEIRIDQNPAERAVMMERTGRHTVPQIFIGNTHVGGCDDLFALERSGGLDPLLDA